MSSAAPDPAFPGVSWDFAKDVVVLTGGGGDLCSSLATYLATECNARVALLDISADKIDAAVSRIKDAGGEAMGAECDVTDKESMAAARTQIIEAYGQVNGVIAGAGGNKKDATTSPTSSFASLDVSAVTDVVKLNFVGVLLTAQTFYEDLAETNGSFVSISSMAAIRPLTRIPAYSAAKAAVSNFTQWLSVHLADEFPDKRVRANAIAPGFFLTEQNRFLLLNEDGTLTERGTTIIAATPYKRFGQPADLHGPVCFLLSQASAFVSGVVLPVDGGYDAFSGV